MITFRRQMVRGGRRISLVVLLGVLSVAGPSSAQTTTSFFFSVDNTESMQGNTILREEVWTFDTGLPLGSEVYGPLAQTGLSMFTDGGQINAFTVRNGVYYLSTAGNSTFADNGLSIDKDDIVRYDPSAAVGSRASLFYDIDSHGTDSNVNALSFHSDGHLLVSFDSDETFAGLSVLDGDVVKFDVADPLGTRTTFFSESTFLTSNEQITGFAFVSDTEMYMLVKDDAQLPGSPLFSEMEIAHWNGVTGALTISESQFGSSGSYTLDALGVIPEPSAGVLVGLAAGLGLRRRSARARR